MTRRRFMHTNQARLSDLRRAAIPLRKSPPPTHTAGVYHVELKPPAFYSLFKTTCSSWGVETCSRGLHRREHLDRVACG